MADYTQLREHETARCSECGDLMVILGTRRVGAPFWRETKTGNTFCNDCYEQRTGQSQQSR